jgi:hypothetical protein
MNNENRMTVDSTNTNNNNMLNKDNDMVRDTAVNNNMNNNLVTQGDSMSLRNNNQADQNNPVNQNQNNQVNQPNQGNNNINSGINIGLNAAGYAGAPQLQTFVPQNVVTTLTGKYGTSVYDITSVKSASGTSEYIVRVLENGQLRTQYVGEDGNPVVR